MLKLEWSRLAALRGARRRPWLAGMALAALVAATGAGLWQQRSQRLARDRERQEALSAPLTTVTALGRLEPVGEVLNVVPPAAAAAGAQVRLRRLLVEEGAWVEAGQLLAEMDSLPRLSRAVEEAEAQVAIAETQLQVAIARQRSQLESQRARVASAEAKLRTAAAEERRYRLIVEQGAASVSLYESKRQELEAAPCSAAGDPCGSATTGDLGDNVLRNDQPGGGHGSPGSGGGSRPSATQPGRTQ